MDRALQAKTTRDNEQAFRDAVTQVITSWPKSQTFLDIGSGDGTEALRLAQQIGAQTIICLDHDEKVLALAKKRGAKIIIADLNSPLDIASNSVDAINCNQTIEHVAKTDLLVKEIFRILKPGGRACLCTPNLASWHNIGALLFGWQPFSSQVSDEKFLGNPMHPNAGEPIVEAQAHLRLFTLRSLVELCSYHRLKVVRAFGAGFYPFPLSIAQILARVDRWHSAYLVVDVTKS